MSRWALLVALLCWTGLLNAQGETVWREELEAHIQKMDAEFADPQESPLTDADRSEFEHLDRYAPDATYRVQATFHAARKQKRFAMATSTDRLPEYVDIGTLRFRIKGRKFRLHVYANVELSKQEEYRNHLFVPFTDLTNAEETYGGGRYLDLEGPLEGGVDLDFNRAYNPYCAYNDRYSCPIPPRENHLDTAVRAGVKRFGEH